MSKGPSYKNRYSIPALFMVVALLFIGLISGISTAQAAASEIHVGSELEFPPYAFVDEKGQPAGFSVDLIKAVADAMGISIYISVGPWDTVWNSLVAGRLDVLPIVAKLPERTRLVDFSLPHTETYDAFFVREGSPAIRTIAAARGKRIVVMRSDAAHHALLERNFKDDLVLVDTIPQGLSLVSAGKHDAFLCSKLIGTVEVKEHGIKSLSAGPPLSEYKRIFSFAVKKGDAELLEKLNQGLMIIKTNGEYERIYEKWLTADDPWWKWKKYIMPAVAMVTAVAIIAGLWLVMLKLQVRRRTLELAERNEMLRLARENLEERVAQRTAELAHANAELEAFIYSASHDLRAPLRHIESFSSILQEDYKDKLGEEGKDFLSRIRRATLRMGRLIDDLLDLSRVSRTAMTRGSVNLSNVSKNLIDDLIRTQPDRKITFAVEEGLVDEGDEGLLYVALQNLIGNAWKFTGGRADAKIEFGALQQEGKRIYFVRDNGAGFDMAYSEKLFKPFHRLHDADEFSGTGIGLATVYRIIQRHGGRIWAEAEVGKGAVFYFTLM